MRGGLPLQSGTIPQVGAVLSHRSGGAERLGRPLAAARHLQKGKAGGNPAEGMKLKDIVLVIGTRLRWFVGVPALLGAFRSKSAHAPQPTG
jgi:hypothetical protein